MNRRYLYKFIFVILMFFLGGTILGELLISLGLNPKLFDAKDINYLETLIYLIYAIIIYILYRKYFRADFKELKNGFQKYLRIILKYFAIFLLVKIGSAILTSIISSLLNIQIGNSENQEAVIETLNAGPIMMIISAVILAPIVEEGIFRLSIRKVIDNRYLFILCSGLLFGFIHVFPTSLNIVVALIHSIVYVAVGLCFAYIYEETDNIWVTMIIHALNNLLSIMALLIL